jgi:hypothetical protein
MEDIVFIHSHGESLLSNEKARFFCKAKGVHQLYHNDDAIIVLAQDGYQME